MLQFFQENDIPLVPAYYRKVGVSILIETYDQGYIYLNRRIHPNLESSIQSALRRRGFELTASENIFSLDSKQMAVLSANDLENLCRDIRLDACIMILLRPDDRGHLSTAAFFTTPVDTKSMQLYKSSVKPDVAEIIDNFASQYNVSLLQKSTQRREATLSIIGVNNQGTYKDIIDRLKSIDIIESVILKSLVGSDMQVDTISSNSSMALLLDLLRRAGFFVESHENNSVSLSL